MKEQWYTRTGDGTIGKCWLQGCTPKEFIEKHGKMFDVKDASYDILDILKPQDLFYVDISPDDCGGIVVPRIPETPQELESLLAKIYSGKCILKGVVTRENLMKKMYEVIK